MSTPTAHRYTITITPMTEDELQQLVDDIRERFGRKHLIHVIGKQPSGVSLADARGGAFLRVQDAIETAIREAGHELPDLADVAFVATEAAIERLTEDPA